MKKIFPIILFFLWLGLPASAAYVEMQNNVPEEGLFDLGPTAFYLELEPGEKTKRVLQVTNREGNEQKYQIEVEDFEGSQDPSNSISLKGKESGRYGAKNWIKPEFFEFTIVHGERQFFEFEIQVPENADAGDHYAGLLVSRAPKESDRPDDDKTSPAVNIKSRVGSLLYIKVKGETKEEGILESFTTDRPWYEKSPINFNLVFRNTGTVRLRPEGKIEIFDMLGKKMETLDIRPANVLRDSVRGFSAQWNRKYLAGRYSAKLTFDPDLGEEKIERELVFWVIPWKVISAIFLGLLLLLALLIFFKKKFRFQIRLERK